MQMHLGAVQRAINVGTDIPLGDMEIDSKYIQGLKEKLLWKYKGDPIKKKLRKEKRSIKAKIKTSNLLEADSVMAQNKFLIEPIDDIYNVDIKKVQVLYPDVDKYKAYIDGKIPFTVLRSSYLDKLRSPQGKVLIQKMWSGVQNSQGDLLLVGNTKLPDVLMNEILAQFPV
jgi:hypothetical protein